MPVYHVYMYIYTYIYMYIYVYRYIYMYIMYIDIYICKFYVLDSGVEGLGFRQQRTNIYIYIYVFGILIDSGV